MWIDVNNDIKFESVKGASFGINQSPWPTFKEWVLKLESFWKNDVTIEMLSKTFLMLDIV
jgi:hypothetical protein